MGVSRCFEILYNNLLLTCLKYYGLELFFVKLLSTNNISCFHSASSEVALALVSKAGLSSVSWFLVGVALGSLVVNAGGSHAFAVPCTLGEGSDGITISGLVWVVEWEGS